MLKRLYHFIFLSLHFYKSIKERKALLLILEKYAPEYKLTILLKRALEKQMIKDFSSAIAITDKIIVLNPNLYEGLIIRAASLESLNYNLDAIIDYEKAILINPTDGNTHGLLGLLYMKIGELDNALKNLKIAVEKGWNMYQFHLESLTFMDEGTQKAIVTCAEYWCKPHGQPAGQKLAI